MSQAKKLSREAFRRARRFLGTQARPLERALFEHRFEGGAVDGVLTELAKYQNADGGFGNSLEPDIRTPRSSALPTGIALRLMSQLGCPATQPMLRRAIAYLMETFDPMGRTWRVVSPDTHEHPHAPWWHDQEGSLERLFNGFRIIPRALIMSSLHHYSTLVSAGWLDELTSETVQTIETIEVLGEGGGNDLEYAIGLAEADNLPQHTAARLETRIRAAIPSAVVRDPRRWRSYCTTPLRVVPSPDTLGADLIQDELSRHLDFVIAEQSSDGAWDPTWSWGEADPGDWDKAKLEWRGHLTLQTLEQLRAFGRIEV